MHARKSIRNMTYQDLLAYRSAWEQLTNISLANPDDERGYTYFAGIHGLPLPVLCRHGDLLFLPWHRAYLYFFELAMRETGQSAAIPWWDWTSNRSHKEGIPTAFGNDAANGRQNPLNGSELQLETRYLDLLRQRAPHTLDERSGRPFTRRDPGQASSLPSMSDNDRSDDWRNIESILQAPTFRDFSNRVEQVHGGVHMWVGGSMSVVPTSAFDPIFWSHHAMIDRLWYLWQLQHGTNTGMEADFLHTPLRPFEVTVQQVLDINNLNYEYADASVPI